ncbi:MAG: hypothetical protein ACRDTE_19700 [Pseudonocardiaceae bacterium]
MAAPAGVSAWLYRQVAAEAGEVARIAAEYLAECERGDDRRQAGGVL